MDVQMNGWTCGWTYRWMDVQMDVQMDGRTDGWMDLWMDVQMDDGQRPITIALNTLCITLEIRYHAHLHFLEIMCCKFI